MKNEFKLTVESKSINESFARVVVSAFVTPLDPTLEELADLKTAVSEAVTNCIVHAYDKAQQGEIVIACNLSEKEIEVKITDYGKGIANIEKAMQPFYTTGEEGERSGMGFTVMQAFCDDVSVVSENGSTTVTLVKKV